MQEYSSLVGMLSLERDSDPFEEKKGVNKMAKVKLNPVMEKFCGKIGDLVFKHYGNEVIVGRNPDRLDIQPTQAQLEHQERFQQAVLYGRLVMATRIRRLYMNKLPRQHKSRCSH